MIAVLLLEWCAWAAAVEVGTVEKSALVTERGGTHPS